MDPTEQAGLVVRTSAEGWLRTLALAYQSMTPVTVIDDAQLGVDPVSQTLLEMGRKANLSKREWYAVFTALGMAGVGVTLLYVAAIDPEPFSKIGFTIAAGAALTMSGGFSAIRILTGHKPPQVRMSDKGFELFWQ